MQRHWSFADLQANSLVANATAHSNDPLGMWPTSNFFTPSAMMSVPALFQGHILFPQPLLSMPVSASFMPTTSHHLLHHHHHHQHSSYNGMSLNGSDVGTFNEKTNAFQQLQPQQSRPPKLTRETYARPTTIADSLTRIPSDITISHFEQSPTAALNALLKGQDMPPVLKPAFSNLKLPIISEDRLRAHQQHQPQNNLQRTWKPTASTAFQAVGQSEKRAVATATANIVSRPNTLDTLTIAPSIPPLVLRRKSPTEMTCSIKFQKWSPTESKQGTPKTFSTFCDSGGDMKEFFRKEKEAALAKQTSLSIDSLDGEDGACATSSSPTVEEVRLILPSTSTSSANCCALATDGDGDHHIDVESHQRRHSSKHRKRKHRHSREDGSNQERREEEAEVAPTLQSCIVATPSSAAIAAEEKKTNSERKMPKLAVQMVDADFDAYEPPPKLLAYDAPISIDVDVCSDDDALSIMTRLLPAPASSTPTKEENNNTLGVEKPGRRGRKRTTSTQPPTRIVSNWKPLGEGARHYVYFNNDTKPSRRTCYEAVQHKRAKEVIRVGACVIVRATDEGGHVGKVSRLFVDDVTSTWKSRDNENWPCCSDQLMASLIWYYRVDQLETEVDGVRPPLGGARELLASRHIDVVSVDTVEEIAFVLTYQEYCRYVAENVMDMTRPPWPEGKELWSRGDENYPRRNRMPSEDTPGDLVFFCRRVYDFKAKRVLPHKAAHIRSMLHVSRQRGTRLAPLAAGMLNAVVKTRTPPASA